MLISPITAIENGWVTHPRLTTLFEFREAACISPNALDFTADRMFSYGGKEADPNEFILSETVKKMRISTELTPVELEHSGSHYWKLDGNSCFDVMSDFYVDIPRGVAALVIVRSTLNRNGLFITSGLYDQGFRGNLGMVLHNRGSTAYIAPHTRIGQLLFVKSENSNMMYAGGYNTEAGIHWTETLNNTKETK